VSCPVTFVNDKIVISKATSIRTKKCNKYYVFDSEKLVESFTAEKKPIVLRIKESWKYIVHVYETTRGNIYVSIYDLARKELLAEIKTLMPLAKILKELTKIPEHVRKIVEEEIFYEK